MTDGLLCYLCRTCGSWTGDKCKKNIRHVPCYCSEYGFDFGIIQPFDFQFIETVDIDHAGKIIHGGYIA